MIPDQRWLSPLTLIEFALLLIVKALHIDNESIKLQVANLCPITNF
jgi:hypothetical protein